MGLYSAAADEAMCGDGLCGTNHAWMYVNSVDTAPNDSQIFLHEQIWKEHERAVTGIWFDSARVATASSDFTLRLTTYDL